MKALRYSPPTRPFATGLGMRALPGIHQRTNDLACVRCRAVTSSHLRGACGACGGDLRCTVPSNVRRTQLTVFRNVAAFHGFPLLQEMAEWLLQDGQMGL
eukprot:1148469-Pelagomonas_calceolata.AAC.3